MDDTGLRHQPEVEDQDRQWWRPRDHADGTRIPGLMSFQEETLPHFEAGTGLMMLGPSADRQRVSEIHRGLELVQY